ncbi:MAG: hypothetical protein INR64_18775 [Caulobacteraceae bacterium]|nr:hypothetical protein [Caulobacter sp.]
MSPRFAALFAAALLATPAVAQPRGGATPNPTGGAPAAFRTGAADWKCHDGRCIYALAPHAAGYGWTGCTASWFPTHGGWRKQNICR